MKILSSCLGLLLGGIGGFIALTALGYWVMSRDNPNFLTDGQSGMIVLITFPVGFAMGAACGLYLVSKMRRSR